MPCQNCQAEFHIFRLKKSCADCQLLHCSACLEKVTGRDNSRRRCLNCRILASGKFQKKDLMDMHVRYLRHFLSRKNVNTATCLEKHDLVEKVLNLLSENYRREQEEHDVMVEELARQFQASEAVNNTATVQSSDTVPDTDQNASEDSEVMGSDNTIVNSVEVTATENNNSATSGDGQETPGSNGGEDGGDDGGNDGDDGSSSTNSDCEDPAVVSRRDKRNGDPLSIRGNRASLSDLETEEDLARLSVRQLKEILARNFVDFKGCVERHELEDRVKRLWLSDLENKRNLKEAEERANGAADGETKVESHRELDDKLCKICMDASIDCVLLECGHMVTCTKCGKVLSECPICRQFVVRAVHVFKA